MRRIDRVITIQHLQNTLSCEQVLEDFGLLEEWVKKHRNQSILRNVVVGCNYLLAEIRNATTLDRFLEIAGGALDCACTRIRKIEEILVDILKKKIKASSQQILSLNPARLSVVVDSIESLGKYFNEIKPELRDRVKERIASEKSLSGLCEVYESVSKPRLFLSREAEFYKDFFVDTVRAFVSSQIKNAITVEELIKIDGSLKSIPYDFTDLKNQLRVLINNKITEKISSQDSFDGLYKIKSFLEREGEYYSFKPMITEKVEQIVLSLFQSPDPLEKLLKMPIELLINLRFSHITNFEIERKLSTICTSEIGKAETLGRLNELSKSMQRLSLLFPHSDLYEFNIYLQDKKRSVCSQEIRQATTLAQLQALAKFISNDQDLSRCYDLPTTVSKRKAELEKSLVEEVKTRFGDVDITEKELLKRLPKDSLLRIFADRIPTFIRGINVELVLGLEGNSSNFKQALRKLELGVHPDKVGNEYRQVATKLWKVLEPIRAYVTPG
jgi:hypothetical protein